VQTKEHWEQVYTAKATDRASWYQAHAEQEEHHTPRGVTQKFVYCYCRKIGS